MTADNLKITVTLTTELKHAMTRLLREIKAERRRLETLSKRIRKMIITGETDALKG